MITRLTTLSFIILLFAAPVFAFGDDAPDWLRQAAAVKLPTYDKDVPAAVLQDEQTVTVSNDGKTTTVTTFAVRVLIREGRVFARAEEVYLTNSGKVKE